jgi:hypothetical protein
MQYQYRRSPTSSHNDELARDREYRARPLFNNSPRQQLATSEVLADAAEGFRHRRGQGVDLLGVVAQLLGAGRAERELLLLTERAGDLGEALLHGGTDFFCA